MQLLAASYTAWALTLGATVTSRPHLDPCRPCVQSAMGETEQYERMMDELREEQVKEAHARMEARNAVEKEKEAAYWAACA